MSKQVHHPFVPRLLLERFANESRQLRYVTRGDPYVRRPKAAKSLCTIDDFYKRERPASDPLEVENWLSTQIETPAGPAIESIVSGRFPPAPAEREVLARFVAVQFLRGSDMRAFIDAPVTFIVDLIDRFMGPSRSVRLLPTLGLPVGSDGRGLTKDAHLDLLKELAAVEVFLSMRLALVTFDEPLLITSDRPVATWGKIDAGSAPFGIGIDVPHALSLHLDPTRALIFVPRHVHKDVWTERVVPGTRAMAQRLNEQLASQAWAKVMFHPEHPLPPGIAMGEAPSFDSDLKRALTEGLARRSWPIRVVARRILGL